MKTLYTLGTVQLGMPYGISNRSGQPSRETARQMLDTAYDLGVRALDTASDYGTSEEVLGNARAPEKFHITSKFSIEKNDPKEAFSRQLKQTLARLGTDHIAYYFYHSAPEMITYAGTLETDLCKAVTNGSIGTVGASVYTCGEIEDFMTHPYLRAIQLPMSVLDQRPLALIERLAERGIEVFVRSVFLQGLLCMETPPERCITAARCFSYLQGLARENSISVMQLAVSYIRDLPGVTSLVLGSETAEQIRSNAALLNGPALSSGLRQELERFGQEIPGEEIMQEVVGH